MIDARLAEKRRIEAVHQFLEIDFDKSHEYQEIVDLASELCEKPVAILTLLDEEVNWLKVKTGVNLDVMPRDTSFCQFVVGSGHVQMVEDATKDVRFDNNQLVYGEPFIRFYCGTPLALSNGLVVGSLCLFDKKPGSLSDLHKKSLRVLARQITNMMELEISHKLLKLKIEEIEDRNKSLLKIAKIQSHEVRHPLATIMGLVNMLKEGYQTVDDEWMQMMTESSNNLDKKIASIVHETIDDFDIRMTRFNKMVEEIEDYAIILLDKEGNIENWNTGAEKIKGYKPIEIIGRNFSAFYTADDRSAGKPQMLLSRAIENGFVKDEGWRVRKDGSLFWGSVLITAIHDNKKEVIGFTKVTRDLTEKKNTDEASKAYIAQLESQLEELRK